MIDIQLEKLRDGFSRMCYIINEEELNTIFLALSLEKPLLVCGPAGVGKTELAKALSNILGAKLIRLQCHGGLDESKALYDWNIQRQLIKIHLNSRTKSSESQEEDLFSLDYILQRPLLQAITQKEQVLLLIDEIDSADRDFEAFLLEVLSDYQISIPEIGTIKAAHKPVVIITNSGERELSEALRRRCVFLYLNYPTIQEEATILRARAPEVIDTLNENIALGVAMARDKGFQLGFGNVQLLDWARVLLMLNADHFQKDYVDRSMEMLALNREEVKAAMESIGHMTNSSGNRAGKTVENGETKD
ncbi:MAG: MoxR family ATPase [Syntrophaceticus sp.]